MSSWSSDIFVLFHVRNFDASANLRHKFASFSYICLEFLIVCLGPKDDADCVSLTLLQRRAATHRWAMWQAMFRGNWRRGAVFYRMMLLMIRHRADELSATSSSWRHLSIDFRISEVRNRTWQFLPHCIHAGRSFLRQRCLSVCLSIRLSVTRVNFDKTNESSAEILLPYERSIHVVFRTQIMVGGGRPLLPEILGQSDPPSFKTTIRRLLSAAGMHQWSTVQYNSGVTCYSKNWGLRPLV